MSLSKFVPYDTLDPSNQDLSNQFPTYVRMISVFLEDKFIFKDSTSPLFIIQILISQYKKHLYTSQTHGFSSMSSYFLHFNNILSNKLTKNLKQNNLYHNCIVLIYNIIPLRNCMQRNADIYLVVNS